MAQAKAAKSPKGKKNKAAARKKSAPKQAHRAAGGTTHKTLNVPGVGKIGVSVPDERPSERAMRETAGGLVGPGTAKRDAKIVELRKQGLGYIAIGKQVGLSDSGVMRILRKVAPKLTGRLEAKKGKRARRDGAIVSQEKQRGPGEDKSREGGQDKEAAPAEAPKAEPSAEELNADPSATKPMRDLLKI